jgi:glycogen phosphorylase
MQQRECHLLKAVSRDHKFAVAYFSAEYGLHRFLPFYAGGSGFLAGDYIKDGAINANYNCRYRSVQ